MPGVWWILAAPKVLSIPTSLAPLTSANTLFVEGYLWPSPHCQLSTCVVNLGLNGKTYPGFRLSILVHQSISFLHGGPKPPLEVCGLTTLKVEPPDLFANLTADVHPIATKSKIRSSLIPKCNVYWVKELSNLANLGSSCGNPQWKPQEENGYRLLANHQSFYSFGPLPRIDDTVNAIAQYRVFSTIDLRSAYHQVSIKENDKPYTAFQAGDALYQFTRIPFYAYTFRSNERSGMFSENHGWFNHKWKAARYLRLSGQRNHMWEDLRRARRKFEAFPKCGHPATNHLQWCQKCFFHSKTGYTWFHSRGRRSQTRPWTPTTPPAALCSKWHEECPRVLLVLLPVD